MPARTPSRPRRKHDPVATRRRILAAAERLFVEHGSAGTSIRDVAKAAKVPTSLVMHHFGSKSALWEAVKDASFAAYAAGQIATLRASRATPELLAATVSAHFHWLRSNPAFLRLKAWRDLERSSSASPAELELIELGKQRLRDAQAAGWLRPGVDPELLLHAIMEMLDGWFTSTSRACCPGAGDPATDDRYLETVLAMLASQTIPDRKTP
jgi:TetR/AcrR family transcriptional regulator